ncbi:MAG: tRNA 4-thiouridine(8) synthase ThiI [Oscillospiraceae bacterium]|nr:tRNA 4-thiouridine(8) synthase ThiI [Oscillospiraceae bacterium]
MKEIILIKNGELALKGLNRGSFESALMRNLKRRLKPLMKFEMTKSQSTIVIEPLEEDADMDQAAEEVGKVFGIAAYSRAAVCEKEMQTILRTAEEYLGDELDMIRTFKVESRRADKSFPLKSPEISREMGGYLLKRHPNLSVDVHNPDLVVNVEVRQKGAYIHGNQLKGAGGLPVGTSGKAAILISGGLDSPVAAYTMAKRGLVLTGIHFASPPYTSARAEEKVTDLMYEVAEYAGNMKFFIVPFTEIQEHIKDDCPEEMFTVIMRRMMMRVASRIAAENDCGALITGESLGQVASQTLDAIRCTDAAADLPVLRPLIGTDKIDIVDTSRKIGTYDTSIEPYEDCCTVFTPKHPKLHPSLEKIEAAESNMDYAPMIDRAVENVKFLFVRRGER